MPKYTWYKAYIRLSCNYAIQKLLSWPPFPQRNWHFREIHRYLSVKMLSTSHDITRVFQSQPWQDHPCCRYFDKLVLASSSREALVTTCYHFYPNIQEHIFGRIYLLTIFNLWKKLNERNERALFTNTCKNSNLEIIFIDAGLYSRFPFF